MGFFRNLLNRINDVKKKNLIQEIRDLERQIRYHEAEAKTLERRQMKLLGIEGTNMLYNPNTYLQTFLDEQREKVKTLQMVLDQKRRKYQELKSI